MTAEATRRVACVLCGSEAQAILYKGGRGTPPPSNVICTACGLVFISPRVEDPTRQYRSGDFSLTARGAKTPDTAKIQQSEASALTRYRRLESVIDLDGIRPRTVLEIGCGIGSFLRLLRGRGFATKGLEPDPGFSAAGSDLYGLDLDTDLYENATFEPRSFGVIAAFHVLEHIDDPRLFLRQANEQLSDSGVLYLEVPTIDRPYNGDLDLFFWSSHLYSFSAATLGALLGEERFGVNACGFEDDYLWVVARPTDEAVVAALPVDDPLERRRRTLDAARQQTPDRPRIRRLVSHVVHPRRTAAVLRRRVTDRVNRPRRLPAGAIVHVGLHQPVNAGDVVLFPETRRVIDPESSRRWVLRELWDRVTDADIDEANRDAGGIVVGGGGLLLRDTAPNNLSGWQWHIAADAVRRLEVPLVVFAVGYNRFRGQDEFDPVFREHLEAVVDTAAFIGLRNRGSIRSVASYLDEDRASRLVWQPDPTTLLARTRPERAARGPSDHRVLALNVAFDRPAHRYGDREAEVLDAVARAMGRLVEDGWHLTLANHQSHDGQVVPWLDRYKVRRKEVELGGAPPERIIDFYGSMPLVVGMRGHAQLIPFGLRRNIVSLITHDKMGWFLDDIGCPEWGVDVAAPDLEERIVDAVERAFEQRRDRFDRLVSAQDQLWKISSDNLERIRKVLS